MRDPRVRVRNCAAAVARRVAALLLGAALGSTSAASAEPTLTLTLPSELRVGQLARATLRVHLPEGAAEPLLITPFRGGTALEVVRGRLMRSDAREREGSVLTFELPLRALLPGTCVLGVRMIAFVCQQTCRAVTYETSTSALVLGS